MNKLKKIALFVDLSEMDQLLLDYIKKLDDFFDFQELYLVHFIQMEGMSKEIIDLLPYLEKPIDKLIEDEVRDTADNFFGRKNENIKIHIQPENDLESLLEWFDKQKFDLAILGLKAAHNGTGVFSKKIIRLVNCTTLFLPEASKPKFDKIVLPLDFSSYSDKVIKMSKELSQKAGSIVYPVHAIKIGIQYFPFIGNADKIKTSMTKSAKTNFKKYQEKFPFLEDISILNDNKKQISEQLYDFAQENKADLIIIGHKGKTDESDLLIGNVAEKLISNDKDFPILVVK